jgi:hypothetical protein
MNFDGPGKASRGCFEFSQIQLRQSLTAAANEAGARIDAFTHAAVPLPRFVFDRP